MVNGVKQFVSLFVVLNGITVFGCPDQEDGLLPWSDASSWDSNTVPADGSVVTIDRSILLDVTSVTVSQINIINTGRLVLSDQVGEITITADGILVKDDGELIIGSESCRFQNIVNIRLTGIRTADRDLLDAKGEKFIALEDNAVLQIYGQEKLGWTKLSETVERWTVDNENIVYSHTASPYHADTDKWNEGLAMYVFYDCNEQPRYYRVFDFAQNGNTNNEQRAVDEMKEALEGVADGEIVAIATQRLYRTTANTSELFEALETMTGISRLALRDSEEHDAYALVFQKGGESNEDFDAMIGKDGQVAMASIVINGDKVNAISTMQSSRDRSKVDFRILKYSAGFPTISVTDDVSSWQVGDEIILTTTDFSRDHTEVRKVKEISSSHSLTLSDELDYRHFGHVEDGVDMRAEVGLLTRNVKIMGVQLRGCPESNENCEEFEHDTYGAHVKIFGFSSVHVEGVELMNVGQAKDNGFYPLHFHMCQDISGKHAVLKGNSFHNSYARAITIHGTWGQNETHHGVKIQNNVAYDIIGHCYFTEDGAEKATIIDGNLGASIKSIDTNGFETDRTAPTVFWITNPKVILTNNVGCGAEGFGIWYTFPNEPVGPSAGLGAYEPGEAEHTPIWTFDNNVVHSNTKGGMRFDDQLVDDRGRLDGSLNYLPVVDPFDDDSDSVKVQITRLTAYKNFVRNTWLRGGYFELMQYSSAESRKGVQLAKRNKQHCFVKKSIFVGRSRDNCEDPGYPDAPEVKHYFGVVHYDGPIYIDQTWFNGFQTVANQYVGGALGFNPNKDFHDAYSSNVTDIRFGFVDKADGTGGRRIFDGYADLDLYDLRHSIKPTASFRDGDASVLRCPGEDTTRPLTILTPQDYLITTGCQKRNDWQMIACEGNYGKLNIGVNPNTFQAGTAQLKRMNRQDPADIAYEDHSVLEEPSTQFMAVLGSDKYYYQLQFLDGFPRQATVIALGVERYDSVVVGMCLPEGITAENIKLSAYRPPSSHVPNDGWRVVGSLDEIFADDTMTRVYIDGRTLYVNLASGLTRDPHWDKLDNTHCPSGRCPVFSVEVTTTDFTYTPCFTPENTTVSVRSMTCDLPASAPDADWGAGDTRRATIEAQWGEWSSWSECCGDQETYRYRLCDDPSGKGGAECPGDDRETQMCPRACPVDGAHSLWTMWSDCFCGGIAAGSTGAMTRTRVCKVQNDGEFCWGALEEHRPCYGDCI